MSIKKLDTDLWQLRIKYRDAKGKTKDLRRRFSGSYVGAKAVHAELVALRAKGELATWLQASQETVNGEPSAAVSVREFSEIWLRKYAKPEMKPSSYKTAEADLRLHALPVLGDRLLPSIRPKDITNLMGPIKRSRSARTANRVRTNLSSMFAYAVREEYIDRNPIDKDRVPRLKERKKGRFENFMLPEEARRFMDEMARHPVHKRRFPLYLFLLESGVRFGEIAALLLKDCDLQAGRAYVYRSVHQGVPSSTKGEDERVIPLSDTLRQALQFHVANQRRSRQRNPHRLVFPSDSGGYMRPETLRWSMRTVKKVAGIDKRVTIHGLRHSFCTMLALDGFSALQIAVRAGHSDAATSQRYIHLAEALGAGTPEILNRIGEGLLDAYVEEVAGTGKIQIRTIRRNG